jgi:hypothetical protein
MKNITIQPVIHSSFTSFSSMLEEVCKVSHSLDQAIHWGTNGKSPENFQEMKQTLEKNVTESHNTHWDSQLRFSPTGDNGFIYTTTGGVTLSVSLINGIYTCWIGHRKYSFEIPENLAGNHSPHFRKKMEPWKKSSLRKEDYIWGEATIKF